MMNTDASLAEPFAAPDRALMDAARQQIHTQIASLTLDFLPAMKEKLLPLKATLNAADSQFADNLATLTAQLKTFSTAAIDQKQQQIDADQSLSNEQKNQALTLLDAQRVRQALELNKVLAKAAHAIASTTDDLQQIRLQLVDSNLTETLQGQLNGFNQQAAGQKAKMDTEAEDRRLLDERSRRTNSTIWQTYSRTRCRPRKSCRQLPFPRRTSWHCNSALVDCKRS